MDSVDAVAEVHNVKGPIVPSVMFSSISLVSCQQGESIPLFQDVIVELSKVYWSNNHAQRRIRG